MTRIERSHASNTAQYNAMHGFKEVVWNSKLIPCHLTLNSHSQLSTDFGTAPCDNEYETTTSDKKRKKGLEDGRVREEKRNNNFLSSSTWMDHHRADSFFLYNLNVMYKDEKILSCV